MKIQDGQGTGNYAGVDNEGRVKVLAVTVPNDFHTNEENGKVWSIPFEGLNPAGADDYVVYIKNNGDVDLLISDMRLMADTAATQIEINVVSGTASGGAAITPVSRTVGSSAIPTATIESGTDITGLTSGGTLFFMQLAVVNTDYHLRTSSNIRIPKGKAIGVLVETATANITGVISLIEAGS